MKNLIVMLSLVLSFALPAHAATRDEQRTEIQNTKKEVLSQLYKLDAKAQSKVNKAFGYAVFSSADIAALFISGSYGRGVAHNNHNGDETYMKMGAIGAGLGVGIKDFRVVFVFNTPKAYHDFVTTGLDMSAHADVAAKADKSGGALTGAQDVLPGVQVYQMTESGLMAQIMLKGTKYWRDSELNEYDQSSDASQLHYNN